VAELGRDADLSPRKKDHWQVDVDDRFRQLITDAGTAERDEDSLSTLAQRYSYVFPDDRSLAALARLGPLVEMGAGTGYWAYRLRALGVDIVAFDQAPPDGARPNRYHATTPAWTEIVAGDHPILTRYSDRALLLCWPPLFSSLGECLTYYSGNTVAVIGDGGHRTARLRGLNESFAPVSVSPVQALEPFPGQRPTLSIWRRRSTS
jgi:hypothetical protein